MAAHSFTSFAFRASTVWWREEQIVVSRIDQIEKSRGLRSRPFAGQTSLSMNEGFTSESRTGWSGKRERVQNLVAGTRELLGRGSWPRAADNPPKCRRRSAGSSIGLQRVQKAEGTSRSLWRPPKPWQAADFGFWWRFFPLWQTRKLKLGYCVGLPLIGCRLSYRLWTKSSAACRRPPTGEFLCIFGPSWAHD